MKRNKKKWSKLTEKQLRKKKIKRADHITNVKMVLESRKDN